MANSKTEEEQLSGRVEALEREYTEMRQEIAALTQALSGAPDGVAMTGVLDSIPGAFERLQQRQAEIDRGSVELIGLTDL